MAGDDQAEIVSDDSHKAQEVVGDSRLAHSQNQSNGLSGGGLPVKTERKSSISVPVMGNGSTPAEVIDLTDSPTIPKMQLPLAPAESQRSVLVAQDSSLRGKSAPLITPSLQSQEAQPVTPATRSLLPNIPATTTAAPLASSQTPVVLAQSASSHDNPAPQNPRSQASQPAQQTPASITQIVSPPSHLPSSHQNDQQAVALLRQASLQSGSVSNASSPIPIQSSSRPSTIPLSFTGAGRPVSAQTNSPHPPLYSQQPGPPPSPIQPSLVAPKSTSHSISRPSVLPIQILPPNGGNPPQQQHQQQPQELANRATVGSQWQQLSRDALAQMPARLSSAASPNGQPVIHPQQGAAQAVIRQPQHPVVPSQRQGNQYPQVAQTIPAQQYQHRQPSQQSQHPHQQEAQRVLQLQQQLQMQQYQQQLQQQRQQQEYRHQQQPSQSHIQQQQQRPPPYNPPLSQSSSNADGRTPAPYAASFEPIKAAFENALSTTYGQVLVIIDQQQGQCNKLAQTLDCERQSKIQFAREKDEILARFKAATDLHKLAMDDRQKDKEELVSVRNQLQLIKAFLLDERTGREGAEAEINKLRGHIGLVVQEKDQWEARYEGLGVQLNAKDAAHQAYQDAQKGLQERCEEEIRELKQKVEMLEKDAAGRATLNRTISPTQAPQVGIHAAKEEESFPPIAAIRAFGETPTPSPDRHRVRESSLASSQFVDELQEHPLSSSAVEAHHTQPIPSNAAKVKLLKEKVMDLTKALACAQKCPQQIQPAVESSSRQAGMLGNLYAANARQKKRMDELNAEITQLKQEVDRLKQVNKELNSRNAETIREEVRREMEREMDANLDKMIMSDGAVEEDPLDVNESGPGKEEILQQLHRLEEELEVARKELEEVREGRRMEIDVHDQQRRALEAELETARMDLQKLGDEMKQMREAWENMKEKMVRADNVHQQERKKSDVELEEVRANLRKSNEEMDNLKDELGVAAKTLGDLRCSMVAREAAKDKERQLVEDSKAALQRELDVKKEECAKLTNDLAKVQGEMTKLRTEADTLRKSAEARGAEMRDKAERDRVLWDKEREELLKKNETVDADLRKRLDHALQEYATSRKKLEAAEAESSRLRLEIGSIREELCAAREDITKETIRLNAELSRVKAENRNLENSLSQFTSTVIGLVGDGSSPSSLGKSTQPSVQQSTNTKVVTPLSNKASSQLSTCGDKRKFTPDHSSTQVATSKETPLKPPASMDKGKSKQVQEPPSARPSTPTEDLSNKVVVIRRSKPVMRMPPSETAKSRSADTASSSSPSVASTSKVPHIDLSRLDKHGPQPTGSPSKPMLINKLVRSIPKNREKDGKDASADNTSTSSSTRDSDMDDDSRPPRVARKSTGGKPPRKQISTKIGISARKTTGGVAPRKSPNLGSSEAKDGSSKRKLGTDSPSSHHRRPDTSKESEPLLKKRRVS